MAPASPEVETESSAPSSAKAFDSAAGSLDAAYSAGKMSLEGKEYVIKDGDLLHIRNKS